MSNKDNKDDDNDDDYGYPEICSVMTLNCYGMPLVYTKWMYATVNGVRTRIPYSQLTVTKELNEKFNSAFSSFWHPMTNWFLYVSAKRAVKAFFLCQQRTYRDKTLVVLDNAVWILILTFIRHDQLGSE